jgi:hypothetical protein
VRVGDKVSGTATAVVAIGNPVLEAGRRPPLALLHAVQRLLRRKLAIAKARTRSCSHQTPMPPTPELDREVPPPLRLRVRLIFLANVFDAPLDGGFAR